jgi:hypothetical protein
MPRVYRSLAVSAALVAAGLFVAFGAAAGSASPRAGSSGQVLTITLRGRQGITGPWLSSLSMKLRRGAVPVSFSLCGLAGSKTIPPTCHATPGVKLPRGSRMRLEQRRKAGGAWKVVGISFTPALDARLSNAVSGNRYGTVHYRVTLRGPNGKVLRTSNPFSVVWHR